MISHRKQFIYVHINGCAGTSIEAALSEWGEWKPNNSKLFISSQHSNIYEYKNAVPQFAEYFVFTIVRNPWARMVSYYRTHPQYHSHSFSEWVSILGSEDEKQTFYDHARMYSSCASWICDDNGIAVDYAGRFENLDESFKFILSELGIQATLPHLNNSHGETDYLGYYDETTKEIIAKRFHRDLQLFGYEFDD